MEQLFIHNLKTNILHFWRWWRHELSLFMPAWFRILFYSTRQTPLFIRFDNFQAHFYSVQEGTEKKLACFYLHNEGKKQRDLFFDNHPELLRAEKILLLSAKQVLRRNLFLPMAAQDNLNQVVGYELDRYAPLKSDQAYFSTQILGKNKESHQIYVELICISQDKLNYYYRQFQDWELPVDVVCYDYGIEHFRTASQSRQYNLLPKALRPKRDNTAGIAAHILAVCFLLLACIACIYPFWNQHNTLSELEQRVTENRRKSEEVEHIRKAANLTMDVALKVTELKRQSPVMLNIIQQLTAILPKDTWLKSFEYSENKLLLEGFSSSSSALIGLLEASPYFKQTGFVSPVIQDSQEKRDIFKLETRIEANNDAGSL